MFPWQVKPPEESFHVFLLLTHQAYWFTPNQLPIYFCTPPFPPMTKSMPGLPLRNFFPMLLLQETASVCAPVLLSLLHLSQHPKAKASLKSPALDCQFLLLSSYRPAPLFHFQLNFPNCCLHSVWTVSTEAVRDVGFLGRQRTGWEPGIKKNPILEGMSFMNKMCIRCFLMTLVNLATSFLSHSEGSVKSTPPVISPGNTGSFCVFSAPDLILFSGIEGFCFVLFC